MRPNNRFLAGFARNILHTRQIAIEMYSATKLKIEMYSATKLKLDNEFYLLPFTSTRYITALC